MVDEKNPYAKVYRKAGERISLTDSSDVRLRLIGKRSKDGRTYNLPTTTEVAALIEGDIEDAPDVRDIMVEKRNGDLKKIHEFAPCYLPLQYPLLFVYGEDGFYTDIPRNMPPMSKRPNLSLKEFLSFRLQERSAEGTQLMGSGKLLQQFMVDGYIMMDTQRLQWIRHNQPALRVESYRKLTDAVSRGDTNPSSAGRRVVLPSSYTGGQRWMTQNFQDALAICRWTGYPSLFITFTCNPKWPEITRFVQKKGRRPEDRPDILCRVFKIKLDELVKDLKEKKIFGEPNARK